MLTKRWSVGLSLVASLAVLSLLAAATGLPALLKTPGVEVLTPLLSLARTVTEPFTGVADTIGRLNSLNEENASLREQLARAQADAASLREAGEENRQLRALLGYERDNPGREYLPARVIANDPNSLIRSLVIDQGANQGMQKGMVAVTERGLVGRVVAVYPRASRLLLTTDTSFVVNGVVQRSRVAGVASGRAEGDIALQYVDKDADVKEGDLVVSSGLGGGFPKGITLGTVKKVTTEDQAPFKAVRLTPAATSGPLEIVMVILDFVPGELP